MEKMKLINKLINTERGENNSFIPIIRSYKHIHRNNNN